MLSNNIPEDDIKVSIICNTFNHKDYIRDALEGFIAQRTNFRYEVLVRDDASTDGTSDIVMKYVKQYPDLIRPFIFRENMYSQGRINEAAALVLKKARGQYIAFCEGDDYWIDNDKLQLQYDCLEANPDHAMCAHSSNVIKFDTKEIIRTIRPRENDSILQPEEVIMGGGGYLATNSLMYRKELVINPPMFRQKLLLDYSLQILGSLSNGILYLDRCMSCYRWDVPGSWTKRHDNLKMAKKSNEKIVAMLEQLDEDTNHIYSEVIKKRILMYQFTEKEYYEWSRELLDSKYQFIRDQKSMKEKIVIYFKALFPFLMNIYYKNR